MQVELTATEATAERVADAFTRTRLVVIHGLVDRETCRHEWGYTSL